MRTEHKTNEELFDTAEKERILTTSLRQDRIDCQQT